MFDFRGETADEVWSSAARDLLESKDPQFQDGRTGDTRERLQATLRIANPRSRWITRRRPAMNPAFALAEVIWIFCGREDSAFLNFWNPKLPNFAGGGETYAGAYGYRLRNKFGVDQLDRAVEVLGSNQHTRQVVLRIWDDSDLPEADGSPASEDVPCNICSLLKVRNGKLFWTQIMRSNDLFLGFPHNVIQFTYLQEIIAAGLELEVGPYTHLSDSLHIYRRDLEQVSVGESLPGQARHWTLSYPESKEWIGDLAARMEKMPSADEQGLRALLRPSQGTPREVSDMLAVVGADAARRSKWESLADEQVEACGDDFLRSLLLRWFTREKFRGSD